VIVEEGTSNFALRIMKLMERVEYRRADSREDREAIFRMRYEAYLREGYIEPNERGLFTDPDDDSPNAWLIGCFIDGELALSIRLHIASRPEHFMPVMKGFPDIVGPRLAAGALIIDASRMTTRLDLARAYPFLPYLAIRAPFMADEYFDADYITAACREEVAGAYRRMGGAVVWAPPRPYPPLTRPNMLVALECRKARAVIAKRFPFGRSTREEKASLYDRSSNLDADFHKIFAADRRARADAGRQQATTRVA
jgi:hypothetical protein